MFRAALFTATGVTLCVRSLQTYTNPAYQHPVNAADWIAVVSFSVGLLGLAAALPMFAQLIDGRRVFRVSLIPAAGAALAGVTNILEDGMQMHDLFIVFVASAWLTLVGLIAFTVVVARAGSGRTRLWAAVPAATLVGQMLFPVGGGVLMLAAWLAAARLALQTRTRIVALASA